MNKCYHCKKINECIREDKYTTRECDELELKLEREEEQGLVISLGGEEASTERTKNSNKKTKEEIITYYIAKKFINMIDEILEELQK